MDTRYAKPLNEERDKSVPIRTLGFGWLWWRAVAVSVYAPAITCVRPVHDPWEAWSHCTSLLTILGRDAELRVPGEPAAVIDAITDALDANVYQPMHQPPPGGISHSKKP